MEVAHRVIKNREQWKTSFGLQGISDLIMLNFICSEALKKCSSLRQLPYQLWVQTNSYIPTPIQVWKVTQGFPKSPKLLRVISNSSPCAISVSLLPEMGMSKLHQRHPLKNLPHLSPPWRHKLLKPKCASKSCAALPSLQNPSSPNSSQPLRKGWNTSLCWQLGQCKAIQHPTAGWPQLSGPMKHSSCTPCTLLEKEPAILPKLE